MSAISGLSSLLKKANLSFLALGLMLLVACSFVTACGDGGGGETNYNFTLVNNTGYDIKKLFLAPHSSEEWNDNEDLLKGGTFANGATMQINYKSPKRAKTWDMMAAWTDGSPNSKWDNIKLDGASKLTMTYDKKTDTTSINGQGD